MSNLHTKTEELVKILMDKTGSNEPHFFRVLVGFYMSTLAAMMRTNIRTHDRGSIPVNMYALGSASSGFGKTYSTNTLEELMIKPFQDDFIEDILEPSAQANIYKLGVKKATRDGTDPKDVVDMLKDSYESMGAFVPTFDSATSAAVKQLRSKLLLAEAGSLNLIVDEVGSNLTNNLEALTDYLSLFDKGLIKQKITKATAENKRGISLEGVTPANLLLFGTPTKLLNGGKTEEEFFSLLETGYARRLFFAFVKKSSSPAVLTAEQIYTKSTCPSTEALMDELTEHFASLADVQYFNQTLTMDRETAILVLQYKLDCEELAKNYKDHQEIFKAEMAHRYYKTLKLAGSYAFIDKSPTLTLHHFKCAMEVAEESGRAFKKLVNRERNYVKLAKYLSTIDHEVTQPDLVEDLPFYNGSISHKKEMMDLAIAYGYKNNIVIRRSFDDGIEFFIGESLKPINLEEVHLSISDDVATGYSYEEFDFNDISQLTQQSGLHFTNHALLHGHRNEVNSIPGTEMAILDVDGTVSLKLVKTLLEDFTYHIYTTKRHTEEVNRFRIILPLSHKVKLDAENYKLFMDNICAWLAFEVDSQTHQRSRKWLTNAGEYWDNKGALLDVTLFIPKTSKSDDATRFINENSDLSALERWFVKSVDSLGRNNVILKYAFALKDKGFKLNHIEDAVSQFNKSLPKPLKQSELEKTVFLTLRKKIIT